MLCPLYTHFDENFYYEWILNLIKCFLCIYWDDMVIFIFLFVNVVYHNDYIEPSLWLWSELNLIIVYDPVYVLLDLVCSCFVEDFCIYVHQGYWFESFFFFFFF